MVSVIFPYPVAAVPVDSEKTAVASAPVQDGYQITEKDNHQLRMTDDEYKLQSWDDLVKIVGENRLEDLKRVPSDLKRYISWSHATREAYGSIQAFVLKERLGWKDLNAKNPLPFVDPEDTKILLNDWPYGNEPGIMHLVCWTKAAIPTEPVRGDLTPESRLLLQDFVDRTFIQKLGAENVLWFKNWASIQSVRSVEHIHVLIRNYDEKFVESIVGKDARYEKPIGQIEREKAEERLQ